MRELAGDQRVRYDAYCVTPAGKDSIGNRPHQADCAAAEHQTDASADHLAPELRCRLRVERSISRTGAAEDTNAPERR
jgi:hypothetical protein